MNVVETDHPALELLADRMLRDYDAQTPGTVFAEGLRLSIEDAWKLQDAVARLRERRGEQIAGYKIGCVCPENRKSNGLSHPVSGRLWTSEQHPDGAALSKSDFANVAIEGEFAILLSRNIDPGCASIEMIVDSVERVFPVIELHNLMFRGADPKGHELIANNAIHCGVVRGVGCQTPTEAVDTDLSITFDGEPVEAWRTIRWPEDILQSVAWLSEYLNQTGRSLQCGQTILTGAFGPPLPVSDISRVRVVSSQFGEVAARFDV